VEIDMRHPSGWKGMTKPIGIRLQENAMFVFSKPKTAIFGPGAETFGVCCGSDGADL
jgi:hypothetical protein